jgi:hypothetical protein
LKERKERNEIGEKASRENEHKTITNDAAKQIKMNNCSVEKFP